MEDLIELIKSGVVINTLSWDGNDFRIGWETKAGKPVWTGPGPDLAGLVMSMRHLNDEPAGLFA
jgi:hypothetical protein